MHRAILPSQSYTRWPKGESHLNGWHNASSMHALHASLQEPRLFAKATHKQHPRMLCQIATSLHALHASLQKPRLFAKAKKRKCMPLCKSHAYSQKQQRRNWRPVTSKTPQPRRPSAPGEVVAVDQLVSPTPGLIAQMTGSLTKKRYKYATIFVDHYSGLGFVYLQQVASAEETLDAKRAF